MLMREIEAQDDAALVQIIRQALEAANLARTGTAYFDPELEHLSRYYQAAPDRGYVVAVSDDGVVLGGAGYAPYAPAQQVAELQKVYLTPAARGRGLSYQLLQAVEQRAKQAGFRHLYLETHHTLTAARHVYEKMGFQELPGPMQTANHQTMDRFMIKDL